MLVYCEGRSTERLYFLDVRAELRGRSVLLELGGKHGEPVGLVREAKAHRDRCAQDDPFNEVWCVFDAESPQQPRLEEAVRDAARADISCAVSNPCFELWLILHYRAQTGAMSSKEAQSKFAALHCAYDGAAGKRIDCAELASGREQAIARADALHQGHAGRDCIAHNPCTTLPELLRVLKVT